MKRVVRLLAIPAGCFLAGCAINVDVQHADSLGDLAPRISLFKNRERMLTQHSNSSLHPKPNFEARGTDDGLSVVSRSRTKFGSRVARATPTQPAVAKNEQEPGRLEVVSAKPLSDEAEQAGNHTVRQVNVFDEDFARRERGEDKSIADPLEEPGRLFDSGQPATPISVVKPIPDDGTSSATPRLVPVSSQGSSTLVIPVGHESIEKRQQAAAELIRKAREKLETRQTSTADDLASAAQDLDAVYQLFDDRPELVMEERESADEAISLIEQALEDLRAERVELARQKTVAARKLILSETNAEAPQTATHAPSDDEQAVQAASPDDDESLATESVRCRIRIKRTAANAARDVKISLSLPKGSSFVEVSGPVVSVVETLDVSYSAIEKLAFGAEAVFDVTMSLPVGGDVGLKVRIEDDQTDSNQANAWEISIERLP